MSDHDFRRAPSADDASEPAPPGPTPPSVGEPPLHGEGSPLGPIAPGAPIDRHAANLQLFDPDFIARHYAHYAETTLAHPPEYHDPPRNPGFTAQPGATDDPGATLQIGHRVG